MRNQSRRALVSALFAVCIASAHAGVVFKDQFDNRSFSGWQPSGNKTATIVNSPVRAGNYAAQLSLDRLRDKVPSRTELSLISPRFEIGKDYWIGFSNYLPAPGSFAARGGFFAFQIHKRKDSGDDSGRQPLTLNVGSNGWSVNVHYDANATTINRSDGDRHFAAGAIDPGHWTDWVVHISFSYQSDGQLDVWKNGAQIVNYQGPNCYNDKLGPYVKIGIYNPFWTSRAGATDADNRTIYYDAVSAGDGNTSYAGVAP